ncbi:MAG: hypothetical protein COA43_03675 [Robiginitomaculum sp.]|nr:MAG: hypothetical protein COA43_03675 [Robiginitomaculum sp.]
MFRMIKLLVLTGLLSFLLSPDTFAKLPDEVLTPYKAYRAALKEDDNIAAKENALKAWKAAEKHLGDHKTTGDLAINYANINPTGKEKNPYKNYVQREKAFHRGIKLSSFYKEESGVIEVERRIALADLDLTVARFKYSRTGSHISNRKKTGNLNTIDQVERAIKTHSLQGSTFDGDLQVLFTRYYQLNDNPKRAIEHAEKAIRVYESRTDDYFTKYAYLIYLYKGNSHYDLSVKTNDIDEKIKAALEFQIVMQNLQGLLPAKHPFVRSAFVSWMKIRSDIANADMLEKAENAGLCECWPYENYKDKAVPLKRVPPKMPSSARRSGHVYVKFDVNDEGKPENIHVVSSSNSMFEKSAIQSVGKWKYSKLEPNVAPKNRKNIATTISYRLSDSSGNIIPE